MRPPRRHSTTDGSGDDVALVNLRRDTDDDRSGGDVLDDQRVGADLAVVTDGDVTNDLGTGADEDTIANRGVTLEVPARASAEGDLVVHQHVVTHDRCLPDDHPHAVVNEEPTPDRRSRMDLDSGEIAGDLGQQTSQWAQRRILHPDGMGETVCPDGMDALVCDGDHEFRRGGGVLTHGGVEVLHGAFLPSLEGLEEFRRLIRHGQPQFCCSEWYRCMNHIEPRPVDQWKGRAEFHFVVI